MMICDGVLPSNEGRAMSCAGYNAGAVTASYWASVARFSVRLPYGHS
jgi:hypothetical protein